MKSPDAISILSAGIKRDSSGRWMSTDMTAEDDKSGAPGGKYRVLAAAILAIRYPTAMVIPSGGKGYDVSKDASEDRPLLAKILRDELVACGVPAERILLEEKSNTTYQALRELEKMILKRGWRNLIIVTNRYHTGRVRAMISSEFVQREDNVIIELVSAEDVLIASNPDRWRYTIVKEYESEYIKKRYASEQNGVRQIRDGTYKFR